MSQLVPRCLVYHRVFLLIGSILIEIPSLNATSPLLLNSAIDLIYLFSLVLSRMVVGGGWQVRKI